MTNKEATQVVNQLLDTGKVSHAERVVERGGRNCSAYWGVSVQWSDGSGQTIIWSYADAQERIARNS